MPFQHEKLNVYRESLDFAALANEVVENMPKGKAHIADQLARASTSIVLNIAEGTGKFSDADKRRYYLSASGSASECAAIFDILLRFKIVDEDKNKEAKIILDHIISMLIGLARAMEERRR
jgi:four helix bundle protein